VSGREALLRGISETGVPIIETQWVPASKQSEIGATFTKIAGATLQYMFGELGSFLDARNAFSRADNPGSGHPGARDFLDLAGGTRAIVDLDTLSQLQIDDVLFARHLSFQCRRLERP
jgi:hypothetical protein